MNIINITSPKQLPKDTEFYLFDKEADVLLMCKEDAVVYCLTRLHPKEYKEWYVENK